MDDRRGRSGDGASQASREIFANGGSYSSLAAAATVQLLRSGVGASRLGKCGRAGPREGREKGSETDEVISNLAVGLGRGGEEGRQAEKRQTICDKLGN